MNTIFDKVSNAIGETYNKAKEVIDTTSHYISKAGESIAVELAVNAGRIMVKSEELITEITQSPLPTKSEGQSEFNTMNLGSIKDDIKLKNFAILSADVYDNNHVSLPKEWKIIESIHRSSGLCAKLYFNNIYGYVCAFAGSQTLQDWKENAAQLVGLSEQYEDAYNFGRDLVEKYSKITFVGHSQGGGEAALCGFCFDMPAITFNPAGLSSCTIKKIYFHYGLKKISTNVTPQDFDETFIPLSISPVFYNPLLMNPSNEINMIEEFGRGDFIANLRDAKVDAYIFWSDILNVVQQSSAALKKKTLGLIGSNIIADGNIYYVSDYIPRNTSYFHSIEGILQYFGV